ncbi:hypothetical protein OQA88_8875 [Cercophora sp. LCS_1]
MVCACHAVLIENALNGWVLLEALEMGLQVPRSILSLGWSIQGFLATLLFTIGRWHDLEGSAGALDVLLRRPAGVRIGAVPAPGRHCEAPGSGVSASVGHRRDFRDYRSLAFDSRVPDKAHEPAIEEPATDEPVIDEPVIDEPVIGEPVIGEPAIDEPAIDEPVLNEPVFNEPVFNEPVTWSR